MGKIVRLGGEDINDKALGVIISETNIWDTPEKELTSYELAQHHGSVNTFQKFKSRELSLTGWIEGDGVDEFENRLDNIKRNASDYFTDLAIGYGTDNTLRTYRVIIQHMAVTRKNMPDFATFVIKLQAPNPFASGASFNSPAFIIGSPSNPPKTAQKTFFVNNFDKTSTAEIAPVITLSTRSFTQSRSFDLVDTHLTIGNPDNNRFLKIFFNPKARGNVPILAGDIFVCDCLNRRVLRNNVEIYTEGITPVWLPSNVNSVLQIGSNSDASWSFSASVQFTHRYL